MREIKFRVFWGGVMQYSPMVMSEECYEKRDESPEHCYVSFNKCIQNSQKNSDIWMQYTGLKDNNGIDIYEGDIIKFQWPNDDYDLGKVIYNKSSFTVNRLAEYGIDNIMLSIVCVKSEIVGNIYQNSEILESEINEK